MANAKSVGAAASSVTWVKIADAATSKKARELLATLAEANAVAKAAREELESFIEDSVTVPKGKALVFGYRFGPSFAIVAQSEVTKKAPAVKKDVGFSF